MTTQREERRSLKEMTEEKFAYYAFCLAPRHTDGIFLPLEGPWGYESIRHHGNEWVDFLLYGYELWICDASKGIGKFKKIRNPEVITEEIERDFATDGCTVRCKYKYHGRWLVVKLSYHSDEPPDFDNCCYYTSETDYEKTCFKEESPKLSDDDYEWASYVSENYIYLCDEHLKQVKKEYEEIKKEEEKEKAKTGGEKE